MYDIGRQFHHLDLQFSVLRDQVVDCVFGQDERSRHVSLSDPFDIRFFSAVEGLPGRTDFAEILFHNQCLRFCYDKL